MEIFTVLPRKNVKIDKDSLESLENEQIEEIKTMSKAKKLLDRLCEELIIQ
jgi:hypothetical protein